MRCVLLRQVGSFVGFGPFAEKSANIAEKALMSKYSLPRLRKASPEVTSKARWASNIPETNYINLNKEGRVSERISPVGWQVLIDARSAMGLGGC